MNAQTQVAQPIRSTQPAAGGLLQRQCACGNHTTAGGECEECKKKKNTLQRKLAIGATNDPLELEADRVASQVLATPANLAIGGAPPKIQRFTGQSSGQAMTAPASVDHVLASSGRPLEPALQQDMSLRFGQDFSMVRVHSSADAAQSARDVQARAYTVGHNIVFGANRFAPETHEGQQLLAHELTHVVQQGNDNSSVQRKPAPVPVVIDHFGKGIEGVISNTWSAALREFPNRTSKVLADLPRGHKVLAKGGHFWIKVQTIINNKSLEGYVSYELLDLDYGPAVKDVLRLDQTVPIKGLASQQSNYVDRAIQRIESAPLGPDITLIPRTGTAGQDGISILKGDFYIDNDPLSGSTIGQNQVYQLRKVAEAVVADLDSLTPDTPNYAYYLKDGIIFPTILSNTTIPNLMRAIRKKREQDLQDLKATGELAEAVLWWYIGARFPIKIKGGTGTVPSKEAVKEAAKGTTAAKVAFDAAKVADELFAATKSLPNAGQKMIAASRQLSTMGGLIAAQKVQVMLEFFKRIGFIISSAGVVDDGARFVMYSEDSRYAFAFVKSTGEILYGKFNMQTLEYIWEVLR